MEQPIAQRLGIPLLGLAAQTEALEECDQVLRDEDQLHPSPVGAEVVKGQVFKTGVLAAADAVFDPGATTMARLEPDDVASLVGDENLEPVAVGVGELELG